jgi:chaperonin GroES
MKKVLALHDKVLLQKSEEGDKVDGGIIIPDNGRERSNFFTVVGVGEGMYNPHIGNYYPMKVQEGDTVVVPKAVVTEVQVDGETFYICREVEILLIIKD